MMRGNLDQPPIVIGVSLSERAALFTGSAMVFFAVVFLCLFWLKGWTICLVYALMLALTSLLYFRERFWPHHLVLSRDGIRLRVWLRERFHPWDEVGPAFVENQYTGVGILTLIPVVEIRRPGMAPRRTELPADMELNASDVISLVNAARERWS